MSVDAKRVERIRARVGVERTVLSQIKVTDRHLQHWLGMASNQLDDVEGFFLRSVLEDRHGGIPQSRTDAWLTAAEDLIKYAAELREYVEGIIAKFGPDVRSFGG